MPDGVFVSGCVNCVNAIRAERCVMKVQKSLLATSILTGAATLYAFLWLS